MARFVTASDSRIPRARPGDKGPTARPGAPSTRGTAVDVSTTIRPVLGPAALGHDLIASTMEPSHRNGVLRRGGGMNALCWRSSSSGAAYTSASAMTVSAGDLPMNEDEVREADPPEPKTGAHPKDDDLGLIPGGSSLSRLIHAYRRSKSEPENEKCQNEYRAILEEFRKLNGEIKESYFASESDSAAVIVDRPRTLRNSRRKRSGRRLLVTYERTSSVFSSPEFEQTLWRAVWTARRMERGSDLVLPSILLKVNVELLHQIVSFLLGTLDSLDLRSELGTEDKKLILDRATEFAQNELDKLDATSKRAAIDTSIRNYLLGLPVGLLFLLSLGLLLAWAPGFTVVNQQVTADILNFGIVAIAAGALGSTTSVMIRVTRGQRLVVDIDEGTLFSYLGGFFRPLVGALFGFALYVLTRGGLFPIDIPETTNNDWPYQFFAGLAFIAGFSERWAQDTILRSAPIAPSQATTTTAVTSGGPRSGGGGQRAGGGSRRRRRQGTRGTASTPPAPNALPPTEDMSAASGRPTPSDDPV
jgi:hypothetical protein